jgi:DNA-binding NarL/FixJ family response regulator
MCSRVLVVDDQETFRAAVRELLEQAGFDVVGEAGDAASALAAERRLRPDVVLLDVRLADSSGIEVARVLRDRAPAPVVVLISTGDYAHLVEECGAVGFVPKAELSEESLRRVLDGVA